MKASQFLTVAVEKNSAVISANMPHVNASMTFAGASCPASVSPVTYGIQSLQVSVPTGENALVALRVIHLTRTGKGVGTIHDNYQFLIPIKWENGKLIVGLEEVLVPPADRLLQLASNLDVSITTSGQLFTTCHNEWTPGYPAFEEKKAKCLGDGKRIVEDPGLLLRFALGQATLEDLEAAATLDKRSQTERELARAKAALNGALDEVTRLKSELGEMTKNRDHFHALVNQLGDELEAYRDGSKITAEMDESDLNVSFVELRRRSAAAKAILGITFRKSSKFLDYLPWVKIRTLKGLFGLPLDRWDLSGGKNH